MIAAAAAAGKRISGGGYRSPSVQIELRRKNCNGNTTDRNPNPACNPLTALPGASRHQQGLAIDFTCNGVLIQNPTNECFVWLAANAGSYGLRNLAQEPWHWSTDGN
jgi:D-alanyl-D-alanine carboxypeptidase